MFQRVLMGVIVAWLLWGSSVLSNPDPSCSLELQILRQLDNQLSEAGSPSSHGWFARRRLAQQLVGMRAQLEARILSVCNDFDQCNESDVAAVTAIAVAEVVNRLQSSALSKQLRQYSLFLGALASNLALQVAISSTFSERTATLLSSSVTTITAILVISLGAPVLERLENSVRRWALQGSSAAPSMAKGRDPAALEDSRLGRFEDTYWLSQGMFGIPGSAGRSLHRTFVYEIRYPLSMASLMAQTDSRLGMEKASFVIAQLLFDLRSYPELNPIEFSQYAHVWFGKFFVTAQNFQPFVDSVMACLESLDPQLNESGVRTQHLNTLYAWFRPRLRIQIRGE